MVSIEKTHTAITARSRGSEGDVQNLCQFSANFFSHPRKSQIVRMASVHRAAIPVEPFEELLSIQKIHVSITPPLCVNAGFLNHATPGIVFLFIPIAKVWFGQKENRQFGLFFSYGLKQAFMCGFQISYIRRIVVVIANERPHGQRRKITRHCLFAAAASGKAPTAPGSAENILTIIPCLPYNETQNQMDKRRQMMRVSKFSDMIPAVVTLAVFTGALVLFPGKGLFVYPVPAYIVFALCECMALLNVWALGKYYVLTDQGIEHKFLGIRYRTTQWDEIGDVMRSRHPQRTQGKEQVLVITRKGAKVLREDAFAGSKLFYPQFVPGWIRGDRFVIRLTDVRNADKILPYVQARYGRLDYDCFAEDGALK